VAAAIEDPAWIDNHAGRVHFPRDYTFGLNLNTALGEDDTVEAPRDHHTVPFDLTLHFGAFAKHHRLLRDDVTFDIAVDAKRAGDLERAFERHTLIDKACPFFIAAAGGTTGPLPSHEIPQTKDSTTLAACMSMSTMRVGRRVESNDWTNGQKHESGYEARMPPNHLIKRS